MKLLDTNSLAITLDNLNDSILHGNTMDESEKVQTALWLSSLQGKPGSYRGMFAIPPADKKNETMLYTGDLLNSNASLRHILGEEALHALLWLNVKDGAVQTAVENALAALAEYTGYLGKNPPPTYCCGKCTDAVLRVMRLIPEQEAKRYIQASLKAIKTFRDGNGKWKRFPFYYTLYTLMDLPGAEDELIYSSAVLERSLKTMKPTDKYKQRKLIIGEKILNRLS